MVRNDSPLQQARTVSFLSRAPIVAGRGCNMRSRLSRCWTTIVLATLVAIGASWGLSWAIAPQYQESTDDAYVSGNIVQVTSEIAGTVRDTTTAQCMPAPVPAVAEPHRPGNRSPLTLYVEDPNGKLLQLVHVEGTGWKYGGPKSHDHADSSLFRKIAFWLMTSAPVAKDIVQNDEPLTVLIDGPTGFT